MYGREKPARALAIVLAVRAVLILLVLLVLLVLLILLVLLVILIILIRHFFVPPVTLYHFFYAVFSAVILCAVKKVNIHFISKNLLQT